MITLEDIESARQRIGDAVHRTPCVKTDLFPRVQSSALYAKMENLQRTGSFKARGALNKLLTLAPEERARGVIAASAGNHAQAVAYHAGRLGISAKIVMPERTPLVKVTGTKAYGAEVVLAGSNLMESMREARRLCDEENRVFVHPYEDALIMAGQGTIGLELLEQNPYLDAVVVPIGGGGLISGIAVALKETNPKIQVIGVQTEAVPSMKVSLARGAVTEVPYGPTIADGIAVKTPGPLTLEVVRKYVDDVVTVSEEEIANAVLLMLEREKTVAEGAGAATLGALIHGRIPQVKGKRTCFVVSGGNIDVNLISRIIERGLAKDGRLVRLEVTFADRPGSLARMLTAVAEQGANVVEVYHNRSFSKAKLGEVTVEAVLETRGRTHIDALLRSLADNGLSAIEVRESGME